MTKFDNLSQDAKQAAEAGLEAKHYIRAVLAEHDHQDHHNQAFIDMARLWRLASGIEQMSNAIRASLLQKPKLLRDFRHMRDSLARVSFQMQAAADSKEEALVTRFAADGTKITPILSQSDQMRVVLVITLSEPPEEGKDYRLIEIMLRDGAQNKLGENQGIWLEKTLTEAVDGVIELHLHKEADQAFLLAYQNPASQLQLI